MGIRHFSHSKLDDQKSYNPSNPDPNNYTILESIEIGIFLVVKIQYHGCTSYEGMKILVFADITLENLKKQKYIDPHFSDNKKYKHPLARFEPTKNGWDAALTLCNTLKEKLKKMLKNHP